MDSEITGLLQKKPEWRVPVQSVWTPAGLGVPLIVPLPRLREGIMALDLDIKSVLPGDTVEILIQKSIDTVTPVTVGKIDIANGVVTELMGVPYWNAVAPIPAATFGGCCFMYWVTPLVAFEVQILQNVGAVMREIFYAYNYLEGLRP